MKVAVSIPDPVYADADALAAKLNTSRSQLYTRALRAFIVQHDTDQITQALNDMIDEFGDDEENDAFRRAAARHVFERTEW